MRARAPAGSADVGVGAAAGRELVPPPLVPAYPLPSGTLQIGHAGDGGLYGELVQDRSFDALAAATGFADSAAHRLTVALPPLGSSAGQRGRGRGGACGCGPRALKRGGCAACGGGNDIDIAWHALPGVPWASWLGGWLVAARPPAWLSAWAPRMPTRSRSCAPAWRRSPDPPAGTTATLTRERPLNPSNLVAMELGAAAGPAGIVNDGYWGGAGAGVLGWRG